MHCPRCGQQQISEEIKFCSRCGLPLGLIAEVVAGDGTLPELEALQQQKRKKRFTRKLGLKFALLWFVFWMVVMLPLVAITDGPEEVVIAIVAFAFCGGFLISLLSFLFLDKEIKLTDAQKALIDTRRSAPTFKNAAAQKSALPPETSRPISDYVAPAGLWKAPTTGELVAPPSVTDPTTKLLNKNE